MNELENSFRQLLRVLCGMAIGATILFVVAAFLALLWIGYGVGFGG